MLHEHPPTLTPASTALPPAFGAFLRPLANYSRAPRSLSLRAGPYYPEGFKPVTLFADSVNVRAWPGGVGDCKVGGNYAPTIRPQADAAGKGFSQVLWLLGHEDGGQLTEVGTMNLFVFHRNEDGEDELVTPPLDGTILPGVTRDSVLALARKWGEFKVSERNMTMGEFTRAIDAGRVSVPPAPPLRLRVHALTQCVAGWPPACPLIAPPASLP